MLTIHAGKGRVLITGPNGKIPKLSENVALRLLTAKGVSIAAPSGTGGSHEVAKQQAETRLTESCLAAPCLTPRGAVSAFRRIPIVGRVPSMEVEGC